VSRPVVLFVCVHNAGRSLAARVLLEHHSGGAVDVRSAGSEPGDALNANVVAVLAERGLDASAERPKLLTIDDARAADVVVTMGCGDACPVFPGKQYEDWPLDDPAGRSMDQVRHIVDQIDSRVLNLLAELVEPGKP
jgi:arsenate reductase